MFETILCIDDDPIALMLCKKVIAKFNFSNTVITAQNGQEALSLFDNYLTDSTHNKMPNLIFLDLNMPVMNGWEFLEQFSLVNYKVFSTIPIIVLSSTIDPEDISKSKKYPNVIEFLSKPITTEILSYLDTKLKTL
ncbi:response regulator [Flavobacterium agrisoli]|uniref:Response regulator n=1 Tax=Flavobacterium agrisoli TaxID=2793066 RepID=A0A934PLN0_9FLAO|nr:response regulator [Flavobacterium agrisoli]MBK0369218.1 response regulator [Flavobacterium agrisoli]